MAIRVLIVDDSATIRAMLQRVLSEDPNIVVVGVAVDGEEAIRKTLELSPDVITMDIFMPGWMAMKQPGGLCTKSRHRLL